VADGVMIGAGNISVDPGFAGDYLDTGTWNTVLYDEAIYQTAFTDTSAGWTAGELAGMFLLPQTGEFERLWIVDNTATTIYVWGDMEYLASSGDSYEIYDLRLGGSSPCRDAANGDAAPTTDILGNARYDVTTVADTGTGTPTYTDMGAYEFWP
jgi:hypothetical protein